MVCRICTTCENKLEIFWASVAFGMTPERRFVVMSLSFSSQTSCIKVGFFSALARRFFFGDCRTAGIDSIERFLTIGTNLIKDEEWNWTGHFAHRVLNIENLEVISKFDNSDSNKY
jgi:hypothetical protein